MRKKFRIKILLVILLIISILSLTGIVNAFSVSIGLDSTSKLKAGDLVVVTLKITNIDAGEGIDAILATLDYDKNVFEEVTEDSFEGNNKWNVNIYSTDTQMFTVTKSSKVNTPSDILTITLKAKDTINANSTIVKVKDISASGGGVEDGGTGDIEIPEVSVTITKESTEPPITNEIANTIINEVTNTTTNTITNIATNTDNIAGGKLPQTGERVGAIVAGISIVAVIGIIVFIKYRNLNIK